MRLWLHQYLQRRANQGNTGACLDTPVQCSIPCTHGADAGHRGQGKIEDDIERYTTQAYRAPEQVELYEGMPLDHRVDIWVRAQNTSERAHARACVWLDETH